MVENNTDVSLFVKLVRLNWSNVHQDMSVGQRKTSESPTGFEPMTFRTPVGCSDHWAQETRGELGHVLGCIRHASCVLLGSAMSNASCAMTERFSFECRKTKTKVISLTNHNSRKQSNEPIRARSKYM